MELCFKKSNVNTIIKIIIYSQIHQKPHTTCTKLHCVFIENQHVLCYKYIVYKVTLCKLCEAFDEFVII